MSAMFSSFIRFSATAPLRMQEMKRCLSVPACLKKKKEVPLVFEATLRDDFKKEARERATANGLILGLLQDSQGKRTYINLKDKPVRRVHNKIGFYNTVFPLHIEGRDPTKCIVKHLDFNPIREEQLRHLLLYEYKPGCNTKVDIPVRLNNMDKCSGLKKGGVVNLTMRFITCICNKESIPLCIDVDMSNVTIGARVMLKDLVLPDSVEIFPKVHYQSMPLLTMRPSRATLQLEAVKKDAVKEKEKEKKKDAA